MLLAEITKKCEHLNIFSNVTASCQRELLHIKPPFFSSIISMVINIRAKNTTFAPSTTNNSKTNRLKETRHVCPSYKSVLSDFKLLVQSVDHNYANQAWLVVWASDFISLTCVHK